MLDDRHEIIEFSKQIPIKVFMHKLGVVTKHWHRSLELLMILEGSLSITIDDESYELNSEDILLINSNCIHEIHSQGAVMIAVQIKPELFSNIDIDWDNIIFECNSAKDTSKELYRGIQFAIASLIRQNAYRSEGTDSKNYSLAYYLISELMDNFMIPATSAIKAKLKYVERLNRIINYIDVHYKENFLLSDLAEEEQLSVPYLSSFFDKYMGTKFSQYYTDVKLDHALKDLTNSKDSIETIATNNGFTESHAFVRAFKKKYNMLPSAYRKNSAQEIPNTEFAKNLNYLMVEPSNYLHLLTQYLPESEIMYHSSDVIKEFPLEVKQVSVAKPTQKLRHTFKKFITVSRAKELLNHDIQRMLRDLQQNVGYEYIKFHGIFSDDMLVCSRQDGKLLFRYTLVDMALDFILSIGLKPLIQLSFMPMALASDPNKTVFAASMNTSPPSKMEEWNELVDNFTRHLIARYSRQEVLSWLFCVWNEPTTSAKMFGFSDTQLFYSFYKNTYDTVKAVNPDISFGTPSLLYMENLGEPVWIKQFLQWIKANHCMPDFINIHYYSDIIPATADNFILSNAATSQFPKQEDDFGLFIGSLRKIFKTLDVSNLPIYLTEWNFTLSHRNLINDTCFKSCYIMKNLLKNYDRLDSFGYWCLTDLIEENNLPEALFHGGLGIYTMNGLRKSVYYAFYFANKLGDDFITADEGYFITKKEDSYQIISYNYIHYGNLFAAGELFDITETKRYTAFNMSKHLALSIELEDLENGRYEIKEYYVNREHGSAFDTWVTFGGIPLNPQDTELLKGMCVPGFHSEYNMVEQNKMTYSASLEPLEIRFVEIKLIR